MLFVLNIEFTFRFKRFRSCEIHHCFRCEGYKSKLLELQAHDVLKKSHF